MFIKIPFQITSGNINHETDIKKSIDTMIDLIISTQIGCFKADSRFGFILKNYRFENFDENKGTLYSTKNTNTQKIAGSSKNQNTFAYDLKTNIENYDSRICVKEIKMEYLRKIRKISISISGTIQAEKLIPYNHEVNFHIW